MNIIKDYLEEFSLLPNPLKIIIGIVFTTILLALIFVGTANLRANRQIEKLELNNKELQSDAIKASTRAQIAEEAARRFNLKSANIESQLVPISEKANSQNASITKQNEKTITLRDNLNRVRRKQHGRTDTGNLQRRLENRYGNSNSSQ